MLLSSISRPLCGLYVYFFVMILKLKEEIRYHITKAMAVRRTLLFQGNQDRKNKSVSQSIFLLEDYLHLWPAVIPCPFTWSHGKSSYRSSHNVKKHWRPHCDDYPVLQHQANWSVSVSSYSKRSGQKQKLSTGVEEVTRFKDLKKPQSLKLTEVICSWRNKSATAVVSDKISISTWSGFQKKPFLSLR